MMKNIIMINGTMGVGKTTISQLLKKQLPNSVFLDGDWCWDAHPFIVNEETKTMVINNITMLLQSFLDCSVYENIVFCWVMDEQQIIDTIVKRLQATYDLYVFSLLVDEETLKQRLQEDIKQGKRALDSIERSIERIQKYQKMNTIHIHTENKKPIEIATEIKKVVYQ